MFDAGMCSGVAEEFFDANALFPNCFQFLDHPTDIYGGGKCQLFELAAAGTFPAEPRTCTGDNTWGSYSAVVRDHTNAGIIFMDPIQCNYDSQSDDQGGEAKSEDGAVLTFIVVLAGIGFVGFVFLIVGAIIYSNAM